MFMVNNSSDFLNTTDNYDDDNNNNEEDSVHEFARIFGTEHPWFWRVHITALCALSTSILVSIATLFFLIFSGKEWNVFRRKFSERLVVYLAVADILYSTEHELGHIFAVTTALNNGTFNEDICISSGFMLAEVVCSQGIIIIVTALSAFLMVVLNKKITFGKNDWALLVCSLGIPAVPGAIFAALGWFGPNGFWCFGDMRTSGGPIVSLFYSVFPMVTAGITTICYVGVWLTIQITSRRMSRFNEGEKAKEDRKKYQKTAQVLTLFILSYIAQWWAWIIFCAWSFFGTATGLMVNLVVTFTNLGGVFNFVAYTFVRRYNASSKGRDRDTTTMSSVSTVQSKYE